MAITTDGSGFQVRDDLPEGMRSMTMTAQFPGKGTVTIDVMFPQEHPDVALDALRGLSHPDNLRGLQALLVAALVQEMNGGVPDAGQATEQA